MFDDRVARRVGVVVMALVAVAAAAVVLEDRFGPGRLRRGIYRVVKRAGSLKGAARRLRRGPPKVETP